MLRSNFDPNLLLFYSEIERTLRRARQVRRRIEFENNLRSQTKNLASMNNSSYSSDSDSDCDILSSSDTGTSNMGDLPRITLKQMGRASEDPIKHLKDFDVICATTQRTGGDEDTVKAFAFPFSLEGRAKTGTILYPKK
ncbi:hypothetical protein PIB30_063204 [Stylosanthes scabra]|uniref:Uncharacterized protein n=1 Tax=Stylosanthes scabra TaxID=79078 RepID=A0ABU6WJR9_9FABA|nr:hypothetical protein [Stylosanthes scabra]